MEIRAILGRRAVAATRFTANVAGQAYSQTRITSLIALIRAWPEINTAIVIASAKPRPANAYTAAAIQGNKRSCLNSRRALAGRFVVGKWSTKTNSNT